MTSSPPPPSRRESRARAQGGYVLATILGLLVLSTLLVIAMLAVSQSTIHVEQTGRQRERQSRAAESAVQVAINQIRNSATVATANPLNRKQASDPCPPLHNPSGQCYLPGQPSYKQPLAEIGDAEYDWREDPLVNRAALGGVCIPPSQLIDVDGYQVRVFCYPQDLSEYDQNGSWFPGIPLDDGATAVRLVGGQYQGDTSNPSLTDLAATWKTSFPFSGAMSGFNQPEVNNTKGQLLYTGSVPMKVVGGIQVRNQIAAVSSGSGPALDVQGAVRQGGKGMFDSGSGPADCGIAKDNDSFASPKADVRVDSLFVPISGGLQCNQGDMASMAQTGSTSPNGEWDNDRVQRNRYNQDWQGDWNPSNSGLPYAYYLNNTNVPDDCADFLSSTTHLPSHVISIEAGAYDARATARLNAMFTGCDNMTWIFQGGDYWFDVNDTSKTTPGDPARNSLMLNNRTSNWVFGPPKNSPVLNANGNWAPENFPKACDDGFASGAPDQSRGTSITLSSRTGFYHRAGRVAICGPIGTKPPNWDHGFPTGQDNPDRNQSTAIYQRPSTPLGARLLPTGLNAGDFTAGSAPQTAPTIQQDDANLITTKQNMPRKLPDGSESWGGGYVFTKTFTATGFGSGSPNTSGPDAVSSLWVDITGSGDRTSNANADLTKTRLEVTLPDGTTCWTEYGPNRTEGRRLPSNNTVTSYNLLDTSASGNCVSALGSKSRDKFYGANVTARFTLNPPAMSNTQFSWWDWWPWWRDHVVIPGCDVLNSAIDWFNFTIADIIKWYATCDDRPSSVSYSVNSIVLRLGWTPDLGVPIDGNATSPPWNYLPVQDPGNGAKATPGVATISMPVGFANTSSFSTLRYTVTDPTLLDGFLPLQTLNFGYKITKNSGFQGIGGADSNPGNVVQFTLKQNVNDGIWCRKTVRFDSIEFEPSTTLKDSGTLQVGTTPTFDSSREVIDGCINKVGLGPMTYAADGSNAATAVEVGQLVSHYDHPSGGNLQSSLLDVDVKMANRNTNKVVKIDFVTVSATAGEMQGTNLIGYPKPLDPFTVTWSPITPNPGGDGGWGDASFNAWGTVSVPNNDVRVIWNRSQVANRNAGQLGFPLFNSGKNTLGDCGAINLPDGSVVNGDPTHCRPALVAAALGSWTTMTDSSGNVVSGTWPALMPNEMPDPLASTGHVRFPFRQARIEACVVDPNGSGTNGDLLPRVAANIKVGDRDGMAVVPGSTVSVTQWQSLRSGALAVADALTADCATGG